MEPKTFYNMHEKSCTIQSSAVITRSNLSLYMGTVITVAESGSDFGSYGVPIVRIMEKIDHVISVGNSHRSASPKPTTLEEDREILLILLQFYVDDSRFKPWGPNFFTEFQTLHVITAPHCLYVNVHAYVCMSQHVGSKGTKTIH